MPVNHTHTLAALLALSLPLAASAGGFGGEKGFDGGSPPSRTEIESKRSADFTAADTDGSGGLTVSELLAFHTTLLSEEFSATDTDSNGTISQAELIEARPHLTEAQAAALFALADTTSDAGLDSDEFAVLRSETGHTWEQFVRLDADSDGSVTEAEFLAMPAPPGH